jgi:hypothetical protein
MSSEIDLIATPTPCCRRKAASGAPLDMLEIRREPRRHRRVLEHALRRAQPSRLDSIP